jgi:hypothetical protein
MKKILIIFACFLASSQVSGQAWRTLEINKAYNNVNLSKADTLHYRMRLQKGGIYKFSVLQQGIAILCQLTDPRRNKLYESKYPEDTVGYDKFECSPLLTGDFDLAISRFNDPANTDSGRISVLVKSLTKSELSIREQIKKQLQPENLKNITTIDIDHFWDAYDNLKNCKDHPDSVNCFQSLYLDKATNGLLDFIELRDFTAEKFVDAVTKNKAFYESVRKNTIESKKAAGIVGEVFERFKVIYPGFKPFKVCFAIGIKNTGGTVSNSFVLIGTEVASYDDQKTAPTTEDLIQKIKGIVAHECVHTQQKPHADVDAIQCPLLYQSLKEGSCDFIAELITGEPPGSGYGEKNEKRLWTEFKNELCNQDIGNWLYNGYNVKDKPADLGYFIGYEISKEYYNNSANKKLAIIDIINMTDPIRFLELSRYDQKVKK